MEAADCIQAAVLLAARDGAFGIARGGFTVDVHLCTQIASPGMSGEILFLSIFNVLTSPKLRAVDSDMIIPDMPSDDTGCQTSPEDLGVP